MPLVLEPFDSPAALAEAASVAIFEAFQRHPDGLFCLAAGDTPRLTYTRLAQRLHEAAFDASCLHFVALDEWRGLPPDAPGGCRRFLQETFFVPVGIGPERVAFFDAQAADPQAECRRVEQWIEEKGPLRLTVLGLGMNGHLGFNEPGTPAHAPTRPVDLDETTQRVGAKYFPDGRAPSQGLTLGLGPLMASENVLLLATGEAKRAIVHRACEATQFPEVPAAVLARHPRARFLVDRAAAGN